MRTKFNGFLTLMLALVVQISFAQQKNITGTVTDGEGIPLLGATVLVVDSNRGTSTDFDGNFALSATPGETVEVSFVGYSSSSFKVDAKSSYNVTLTEDSNVLTSVTLVGYGSGRDISAVTGSISTISSDKLSNKPTANVMEALQGQVAGLQLLTSSGEPTALSSIRLHGVGSLNASNTPLFILDGAPIDSATLLTLNSNDFESVTVLKDAAATSIYGSRAANGVIYITTKKGQAGEGEFTLNYEYGFSELARKNQLGLMDANQLLDFQLDKNLITQEFYDERLASGVNTNWEQYFYKDDAPMRKVDLAIAGGSEKTTYRISGQYLDQEGIAYDSNFERYTVNANIQSQVKDWLKTGIRLNGGSDEREQNRYTGLANTRGALGAYLNLPYWTPYDEDGNVYDIIPGMEQPSLQYEMANRPGKTRNHQFNGSYFIELTPIEGLTIRSQYSLDYYNRRGTSLGYPSSTLDKGMGFRSESYSQMVNQNITNTIEYRFDIDNSHNFNVLAGHEGIDYDFQSFALTVRGMQDDRLMEFGAGGLDDMNSDPTMSTAQYAYLSYFGQLNYDYEGKYFVDLSLRTDESSRFGATNRRANFWSVGTMWNLTSEEFMYDVDFVDDLRMRVSYGTTGNSSGIGNYSHLALVGTGATYDGKSGWTIATPGNPQLGWESQEKLTIGISSALFNNKLTLDVDYYLRKTKDMLMAVPQPYTTGFEDIDENVGSLQNQGVDVTLGTTIFQNQDWHVGFTKTFNYNKTKITELFYGLDEWIIPNTSQSYIVGEEILFYAPKWLGIDPDDGMQMWENPETGEVEKVFDEEFLSQPLDGKSRYNPITGGFGFNISWSKGLSFTADFAYMYDKYLLNNDRYFSENPFNFGSGNQSAKVLDEWKEPGDQTSFPKYGESMQFDSRLVEDASFLRLKNIAIAYDVPKNLLGENNPLSALRFSLSARNLFTITNYSGLDPEIDSNLAIGRYPNTRQYVASVRVSF